MHNHICMSLNVSGIPATAFAFGFPKAYMNNNVCNTHTMAFPLHQKVLCLKMVKDL